MSWTKLSFKFYYVLALPDTLEYLSARVLVTSKDNFSQTAVLDQLYAYNVILASKLSIIN